MELIVFFLVGYVLGSTTPSELKAFVMNVLKKVHKYLASPTDDKLELNWTGRQLFLLFNKGCSERWYEARAHLHQGFWLSIACALRLVYLVRVDLIDDEQSKGRCRIFTFHGFQSVEKVVEKTVKLRNIFKYEINKELSVSDKMDYYQTFVAGFNVVDDFMNGSFLSR